MEECKPQQRFQFLWVYEIKLQAWKIEKKNVLVVFYSFTTKNTLLQILSI